MRELQHQNLIRFFAAQCKPPDLCIVMELMLGSLADLLYGKLSKGVEETLKPRRQLSIVKGIAGGMHFLHDHGICHRDLKSANVLFNRHLDVKLCDFAFSKFKQQASISAKFETSVGTPAWMAPEVLRGDEYTLLADVYSFGVIIWEIVCCEAPFKDLNRFQIIFQVGTQGVLLKLPSDTAPIWVAIANACWREKPPTVKSRRPTFRQIVEVLAVTQEQMKAGQPLSDGCGIAAWDAAEVTRESEYVREMGTLVHAEALSPGIHAGIAEDPHREAAAVDDEAMEGSEDATTVPVAPADPDALRPADVPLARACPRRALSGSAMQSPPPESPRGDGA
jgi:serine/threonine protein kinase